MILSNIPLDSIQLATLLRRTPRLTELQLINEQLLNAFRILPESVALTKLVLSIPIRDERVLRSFFQNQQNLRESSLTSLEKLDFREEFPVGNEQDGEEILNAFSQSFGQPLWTVERRWFVQCEWNLTNFSWEISIVTVPFRFAPVVQYDPLISRCLL